MSTSIGPPTPFGTILQRRKRVIGAVLVLALAATALITFLEPVRYQAVATIRVETASVPGSGSGADALDYSDRLLNTYTQILRTRPVREELARRLGVSEPPEVAVSVPANTELLRITVEDSNPERAATAANILAEEARSSLLEEYAVAEVPQPDAVSIVEPATAPSAPASPNLVLNGLLGALFGLVGGVAMAVVRDRLDTRVHNTAEVERASTTHVIGEIPTLAGRVLPHIFNSGSAGEEAFRRLRANVLARYDEQPIRRLLITGTAPGEGTTTVVANLAAALAQTGLKIAVVDADLRSPSIHHFFSLPNFTGLGDVLAGREGTLTTLRRSSVAGVEVLTGGVADGKPADLLGSSRLEETLRQLGQRFDVVLIDSPPLLSYADAGTIAPRTDGVILVARHASTPGTVLAQASRHLAMLNAPILGVVVNRTRSSTSSHRGRSEGDGPAR